VFKNILVRGSSATLKFAGGHMQRHINLGIIIKSHSPLYYAWHIMLMNYYY